MNDPDQKEFYQIQRSFFIRFLVTLIFVFFWIFWAGTFGGLGFIQPILLNPFLLLLTVITFSFGYAALLWDREMRKFQRRH